MTTGVLEHGIGRIDPPECLPKDDTDQTVIGCLFVEPVHVDELRVGDGHPMVTLTAASALLDLEGLPRQADGMHYVRLREAWTRTGRTDGG